MKLQGFDSSYFHVFGDDGSQNMFVCSSLDTLELKEDKVTDYVRDCKSKGLFKSKLLSLLDAFLPNIKYFA